MEITCKKFDYKERLDEQRELFVDCFPENLGTAVIGKEHYMWKFQSFPIDGKKSYEYIATDEKENMVGYYAAIPYQYDIDGKVYTVAMVCDVMTSSKCRGAGIFTKLGRYSTDEYAKEGLAFSTGYPIRKAVIPGHMKVGWKIAFELPLYMHFISSSSLFAEKGKKWLSFFANPFIKLYAMLCSKRIKKGIDILTYNKYEDIKGYEDFETEWRKSVKNSLIKDAAFMKWRYGAPEKKYKFVCAYKDNKLIGLSTIRAIVKEGVPSYGILDFMVLDEHKDAINTLHSALKSTAKENGKEALMMIMSRNMRKYYNLIGNGYLRSPFTFNFIIKKYDDSISDEKLFNEKNWHLMFVDSDDL